MAIEWLFVSLKSILEVTDNIRSWGLGRWWDLNRRQQGGILRIEEDQILSLHYSRTQGEGSHLPARKRTFPQNSPWWHPELWEISVLYVSPWVCGIYDGIWVMWGRSLLLPIPFLFSSMAPPWASQLHTLHNHFTGSPGHLKYWNSGFSIISE